MVLDSEPLCVGKSCPDDFASVFADIFSGIQFKLFGLIFIIFIFISSDVFIGRMLSNFSGATDGKKTTSWGTIIQGMFLVMALIVIDVLVKQKII